MTRTLATVWVDAFTHLPLQGNPCMVVLDADGLSEAEMRALARETNLSETAFVLSSDTADFRARYFTPAEEIPLAGHPTLAVARALVESGRLRPEAGTFTLQLQAGIVRVSIQPAAHGLRFVMTQLRPAFLRTYSAGAILPAFGLPPEAALPGAPIQTVSTGTPQLMIPLRDLDALRRARMDSALYDRLRAEGDFFSPHLFVLGGLSAEAATFARHFGTPPDTAEDSFTGSATGGMAAYLWHHRLIAQAEFIAEQGQWMGRPGQAYVEVVGPPDAIEAVRVGGHAVTLMTGTLRLPPA